MNNNNNAESQSHHTRRRRHTDGYPGTYRTQSTIDDRRQAPQSPSRVQYLQPSNDQPLSAVYFEPSYNLEYLRPVNDPAWSALRCATTQNVGVQNVPSMSTVGIQYAFDQTGSRVLPGCVPGGSSVPPSMITVASRVQTVSVPDGCRVPPGSIPGGSSAPSSTVPVASRDQTVCVSDGTRIPPVSVPGGSSVLEGSRVPSFYTSSCGPQPIVTSVPPAPGGGAVLGGQAVLVSGSSCPLCGRQDYHVHPDGVLVNSSNNAGSGTAPAASSTTLPVAETPGQSAFLAGYV